MKLGSPATLVAAEAGHSGSGAQSAIDFYGRDLGCRA